MVQGTKTILRAPVEVGKDRRARIRGQVSKQSLSLAQGIVRLIGTLDGADTFFSSQPQNIIFDVSHPHEDIQAIRDAVKSTAIALVRVDSTFLPGTTIGATHWVAYAMTKGLFILGRFLLSSDPTSIQAGFV